MDAPNRDAIILCLNNPEELFIASPQPDRVKNGAARTWDDIGAVLGEPATTRLLRLALEQTGANRLVVRLNAPDTDAEKAHTTLDQLRVWCECKLAANSADVRTSRRFGLRALAVAMFALALMLGASVVLQSETVFGTPGPLRVLFSEALVIAGWVVMWRPVEMLLFDPARPKLENRVIRRVLAMPWSIDVNAKVAHGERGRA